MQATPEMKLIALSEAICEVLASVAADVAIFRTILAHKSLVHDSEYQEALELFRRTKWGEYKASLEQAIREKSDAAIQRMTTGAVQ